MARYVEPRGKVTQGDYLGDNIYILKENESLLITSDYASYYTGTSACKAKKIINSQSVKSFQLINTTQTSGMNATTAGAAAVFLGSSFARTLVNAVQVNQYIVAIYFKDGKKCVAQLDDNAYRTLSAGCFVL